MDVLPCDGFRVDKNKKMAKFYFDKGVKNANTKCDKKYYLDCVKL